MNLLRYSRKYLTVLALGFAFTITMAFGAAFYQYDWATASSLKISNVAHDQITLAAASLEGRTKATVKNIQGKVQETAGNITGDPQHQAAGKAKQAESNIRNTAEDVKGSSASLGERLGATVENIQGKVQEAVGNITGDPQDQAVGKAKQAESNIRSTVEDVKGQV